MLVATRNQVFSAAVNPALAFFFQTSGVLTDIYALDFQVFDVSTGTAVQVYPATNGDRAEVDTTSDSPERLGPGRYAATWTVGGSEPAGAHELRWFWQETSTSTVRTVTVPFDVSAVAVPSGPFYILPSEMRAEGVPTSGVGAVTDARLLSSIVKAGLFIERITRRFFEPRFVTMRLDGKGALGLRFNMPIIGLDSVELSSGRLDLTTIRIDAATFRVYNRHLAGLLDPDDRNDPHVEMYVTEAYSRLYGLGATFPEGRQNVQVSGLWGYTEGDGTPWGSVPVLLKEACGLLTLRYTALLTSAARSNQAYNGRITSEKTRDQSVTYAAPLSASFTGDAVIDNLLLMFCSPPAMGAA